MNEPTTTSPSAVAQREPDYQQNPLVRLLCLFVLSLTGALLAAHFIAPRVLPQPDANLSSYRSAITDARARAQQLASTSPQDARALLADANHLEDDLNGRRDSALAADLALLNADQARAANTPTPTAP